MTKELIQVGISYKRCRNKKGGSADERSAKPENWGVDGKGGFGYPVGLSESGQNHIY
jgi:hypothetical protein